MPALLRAALESHDWDEVNHRLNESFYFYLFVDPEALSRVFSSAPRDWYDRFPRHVLSRSVFEAVRRHRVLLDDDSVRRFSAWVDSQDNPATRDVLGVQQAGMAALLAAGRYREAAVAADRAVELVRNASDLGGFHDVLPTVMLRCGTAKLQVGSLRQALTLFSEALHWARVRGEHPWAQYAREHMALARALMEQYDQALPLLDTDAVPRSEPGTLRFHYQHAGALARALISAGSGQAGELPPGFVDARALENLGDWWWVAVHMRARAALIAGHQWQAIQEIRDRLLAEGHRAHPSTVAGAALSCDIATLRQSVGDLTGAQRILDNAHLAIAWPEVTITRARQHWLAGRTGAALETLNRGGLAREESTTIAIPSTAVLHAQIELSHYGRVSEGVLRAAATAINASGSHASVTQASFTLRSLLQPHLEMPVDSVPIRFTARERIRLTRREQEMLIALDGDKSIPELARDLHLSVNTVKTHFRSLYRKLGAHSRDEAIHLGMMSI